MSCLRHLSSLGLQSPVVKLAVATGCVAERSTIARLCPSRGSGDRPHRPLSGGPPVSPRRHTIFLKSQCLIESDDGLSKNSETPKKGLQLLYKGMQKAGGGGFISGQSCSAKQKPCSGASNTICMHFSSVGHTESCKTEKRSLVFSGKGRLSHFLFYLSLVLLIKIFLVFWFEAKNIATWSHW